jgi:hypothetical protein
MHYRKTSPTPPRLLLRIVATAGAGALFGVAACGSGSEGSAPATPSDNTPATCGGHVCGSIALPSDEDSGFPEASVSGEDDAKGCTSVICDGSVSFPEASAPFPDGSVAFLPDGGEPDAPSADAPDDAISPCHPCGVVIGIVIHPEDAAPCSPCGVVVHPEE